MQLSRPHLTVLLNALYDSDTTEVTVSHPSDEVGDLLTIRLGDATTSTVRLEQVLDEYADTRSAVNSTYGSSVVDELPAPWSLANPLLAGGLVEPANTEEITVFLDRYGHPDLTAGHRPVVAGFDTNLLPWRMPSVLGLTPG